MVSQNIENGVDSMDVYLLWMYIYCSIFCVRLLVLLSCYIFVRDALYHFYSCETEEMDLLLREETKKCSTLQTQLNVATKQLAEMKGIFTVSKLLSIITKTV